MTRIAALSDVHGNVTALEAVLADVAREKPDHIVVAGDFVLNGPEPAAAVDALRSAAGAGTAVIAGNTDVAVADFDYAAAFPWMTDGVPDAIAAAAEWAHDALGDERVEWLATAVETGAPGNHVELVHRARPSADQIKDGAFQRADGLWVYRKLPARELWGQVMRSTYDHAEPGVLFLDRMNRDNNLNYCETIEATNPCSEQPLPPYGCCCLGSINLVSFVKHPFTNEAEFDYARFARVVETAVRMLDNVLEVTAWPLEQQYKEAMAKRRVGLGFTGLGDALAPMWSARARPSRRSRGTTRATSCSSTCSATRYRRSCSRTARSAARRSIGTRGERSRSNRRSRRVRRAPARRATSTPTAEPTWCSAGRRRRCQPCRARRSC